ncbi:MAG: hypothetical protein NTY30_01455 [Candidatus Berkelbacteria bacterium]|nr:hypothetical protein [Candidatus Berkelbacteria bacterium]
MKPKEFMFVAMIGLSLVCMVWAPVMNLNGAHHIANILFGLLAFCLSASILGKWLLGQREFSPSFKNRRMWNGFLWFLIVVICLVAYHFTKSWQITLATLAGTIIGAIIWSPESPTTNTDEVAALMSNQHYIDEIGGGKPPLKYRNVSEK